MCVQYGKLYIFHFIFATLFLMKWQQISQTILPWFLDHANVRVQMTAGVQLLLLIMGANAKGRGTHITIAHTYYSPASVKISVRYSSRSEGPTGKKNTSLRARRSNSVCYYFSLSLLERNSGKLGISGQIPNGKMHGKGLARRAPNCLILKDS